MPSGLQRIVATAVSHVGSGVLGRAAVVCLAAVAGWGVPGHAALRAGAAAVDITPQSLPVIRNGGFLEAIDDRVSDPLFARCLVLDDGTTRLAIAVVDSCMIPRELCDLVKARASREAGIPADRILISATHTHSAPSVMDYCLGSRADPAYTQFLPDRIVEAIRLAAERLEPAEAGSAAVDAGEYTRCRRWITRPDAMQRDPFGELTVRANMHPGYQSDQFTGPSGPTDPWLTVLSIRTLDGRPLALLANFSMHYFGGRPGISSDYFGLFCRRLEKRMAPQNDRFVAILSQGTSGDLWWGDYGRPPQDRTIQEYTDGLVERAMEAYRGITHRADTPLAMAETRMTLARRTPDEQRLRWAERLVELMGDRRPENRPEVYAMQAVYLHQHPTSEVILQALRVGDLGIATFPNEVYGLTGLKIKLQSPFARTMNIELANGADGYIPPPEQHRLGGYNTWPARTAGLEIDAEPKMVAALLDLLENVSGKPRRVFHEPAGENVQGLLAERPVAYYRLAELSGETVEDVSGHGQHARLVGNFAYHLGGPEFPAIAGDAINRAIHCAGGRLETPLEPQRAFTVVLWFYNGMPVNVRETTGTLLSMGSLVLAISGTADAHPGRLSVGPLRGKTVLDRYRWYQVVVVRDGSAITVYLNGRTDPEITGTVEVKTAESQTLVFGASADNRANFEGRLDEIGVFDRAWTPAEVARHWPGE